MTGMNENMGERGLAERRYAQSNETGESSEMDHGNRRVKTQAQEPRDRPHHRPRASSAGPHLTRDSIKGFTFWPLT